VPKQLLARYIAILGKKEGQGGVARVNFKSDLHQRTGERRGRKRIERKNALGIGSGLKLRATERERRNFK